MVVAEVFVHVL